MKTCICRSYGQYLEKNTVLFRKALIFHNKCKAGKLAMQYNKPFLCGTRMTGWVYDA